MNYAKLLKYRIVCLHSRSLCLHKLLLIILLPFYTQAQDFYFGNDLSYVNQMEDCGAVFKENNQAKDVYQIFADHGTNLVRVRLWLDPSWWQSPLVQPQGVKSYYNDFVDVKETIQRAKDKGMQVMLDIHYSDFWADPAHQFIPRKWLSVANDLPKLKDSVYTYTTKVLTDLNNAGLMPEIVKVGNENNAGLLVHAPGEGSSYEIAATVANNNWTRNAQLYNAAIKAVRDVSVNTTIKPKIALHFTNGLDKQKGIYQNVINHGITDFDIIGFSYYYAWHQGSITELENTVKSLKTTFPTYEVMCVETGYLWTTQNYDALNNIISEPDPNYLPVSPANQLKYMVDFSKAVMKGGGIGVIFWEPAWVSTPCRTPWGVGSSHDHVAFFEPSTNNFMANGGGRWTEAAMYEEATALEDPIVKSIKIFPNPTRDTFQIDFGLAKYPKALELTDLTGKVIKHLKLESTATQQTLAWDVSDLPKKMYVLKIITQDKIMFKRVVLK
jgi:arabinogalactan endo-1,4-beta-galactosidase